MNIEIIIEQNIIDTAKRNGFEDEGIESFIVAGCMADLQALYLYENRKEFDRFFNNYPFMDDDFDVIVESFYSCREQHSQVQEDDLISLRSLGGHGDG